MDITEPVEKKRRLMHRYVNKKRESSKMRKVRGEEYVTHKGEVVPSKRCKRSLQSESGNPQKEIQKTSLSKGRFNCQG